MNQLKRNLDKWNNFLFDLFHPPQSNEKKEVLFQNAPATIYDYEDDMKQVRGQLDQLISLKNKYEKIDQMDAAQYDKAHGTEAALNENKSRELAQLHEEADALRDSILKNQMLKKSPVLQAFFRDVLQSQDGGTARQVDGLHSALDQYERKIMDVAFSHKVGGSLGRPVQFDYDELYEAWQSGICFAAGTKVKTSLGYKPIEQISEGDLVFSKDENTGESGYKKVLRCFENETDQIVALRMDGEKIHVTPLHPFWTETGWKAAGSLEAGQRLQGLEGKVTVEKAELLEDELMTKVYNLEVADWHTYFVSELGILVHNKCITTSEADKMAKDHGWIRTMEYAKDRPIYIDPTSQYFTTPVGNPDGEESWSISAGKNYEEGTDIWYFVEDPWRFSK